VPEYVTEAEPHGDLPTQAWGRTADGRPWYFRARHGRWTIEVGDDRSWPTNYAEWPRPDLAFDQIDWEQFVVAEGEDDTLGSMEADDVHDLLAEHLPPASPTTEDPADSPEDGHRFTFTVTSRGSYSVVGEPGHTDSGWESEPWTLAVRAWSLPAALREASRRPLAAWARPEPAEPAPWWRRRLVRGRVSLYLEPRDAWRGAYFGPDAVYVCVVPFVVLKVERSA